MSRPFFIPPWLDELDLKPHPFRVLCHLLRRAGEDGRCYPSVPSIAAACRMSQDTVWPILKALETAGLIVRQKKKFGASNCYLVTVPTTGNEGVIEEPSTTGNGRVVESPQSLEKEGLQSLENRGCESLEKEGCKEIHLKKATLKKSNRDLSPEGIAFAIWFRSTLPENTNLRDNWQDSFAKVHDDAVRLDGRTTQEIRAVSEWARNDSFWRTNFMSPAKLRERKNGIQYFDTFSERMKAGGQHQSQSSKPVKLGGRASYQQP